jgi:S1-C subfamily serine protease
MSTTSLFDTLTQTTASLAERVNPSIVAIGTAGRGTGIVIDTNRVLTNAHHLRDNTTSVHFADGRSVQGRVVGVDPTWDIAIIEVDTAATTPASWAEVTPQMGSLVFAASRAGGKPSITHGFVSDLDRTFTSPMNQPINGGFEHTAPLRQGSSGGPVLNGDGSIVGLNVVRESDSFALAIPASAVLRTRINELAGANHSKTPNEPSA